MRSRSTRLGLLLGMAVGLAISIAGPEVAASTTGGDVSPAYQGAMQLSESFIPAKVDQNGIIMHAGATPTDYTAVYSGRDVPSTSNFIPGTLRADPELKTADDLGHGILLCVGLFGAGLVALYSMIGFFERRRSQREVDDILARRDDGPALMRSCLMRSYDSHPV